MDTREGGRETGREREGMEREWSTEISNNTIVFHSHGNYLRHRKDWDIDANETACQQLSGLFMMCEQDYVIAGRLLGNNHHLEIACQSLLMHRIMEDV